MKNSKRERNNIVDHIDEPRHPNYLNEIEKKLITDRSNLQKSMFKMLSVKNSARKLIQS